MTNSRQRITEFGEVFTSEREVKAMLDLVESETFRIDSRFLEPACGDGNFLSEILSRKLSVIVQRYGGSQLDFERNTFLAVSSLYGIDLLIDNVENCRARLYTQTETIYFSLFKRDQKRSFLESINFIFSKNILHGDALTLLNVTNREPIIFAEWAFVNGSNVVRTDYTLNNLLAYKPFEGDTLFSDLGDEVLLPHPHKKYTPRHFCEVQNV